MAAIRLATKSCLASRKVAFLVRCFSFAMSIRSVTCRSRRIASLFMFADDLFLIKATPKTSDFPVLQRDVDKVNGAVNDVHLSLQPPKCKALLFSVAPVVDSSPFPLTLAGEHLEWVTEWKYLGVILDRKLSFSSHSRTVVTKAKRAIGVLCRKFRFRATTTVLNRVHPTVLNRLLLYATTTVLNRLLLY